MSTEPLPSIEIPGKDFTSTSIFPCTSFKDSSLETSWSKIKNALAPYRIPTTTSVAISWSNTSGYCTFPRPKCSMVSCFNSVVVSYFRTTREWWLDVFLSSKYFAAPCTLTKPPRKLNLMSASISRALALSSIVSSARTSELVYGLVIVLTA